MTCKILLPDKTYLYEGVKSVRLPGFKGVLEVMSRHAELFELLQKGPILIIKDGEEIPGFDIESGSCHFAQNTLTVITAGKTSQRIPGEKLPNYEDDEDED